MNPFRDYLLYFLGVAAFGAFLLFVLSNGTS